MQTPRWSRKADLEASDAGEKVRRGCAYSEFGYEVSAPDRRLPECPQFTRLKPLSGAGIVTMRHVVIQGCL